MAALQEAIAGFNRKALKPTTTIVTSSIGLVTMAEESEADEAEELKAQGHRFAAGEELLWLHNYRTSRKNQTTSYGKEDKCTAKVGFFALNKINHNAKFDEWLYILCGHPGRLHSTDPDYYYVEQLSPDQIHDGELCRRQFDLLIFPGGSIFDFEAALCTERHSNEIHQYVQQGGAYLGVCAGAFWSVRNGYNWEYKHPPPQLLPLRGTTWRKGVGTATHELTKKGREVFHSYTESESSEESRELNVRRGGEGPKMYFANGAVFDVSEETPATMSQVEVLAYYTHIKTGDGEWKVSVEEDRLAGVVCGQCDKGRVLVYGAHPEASGPTVVLMLYDSINWLLQHKDHAI